MAAFPVFLFGLGFIVVGAIALTVYIAYKGAELP